MTPDPTLGFERDMLDQPAALAAYALAAYASSPPGIASVDFGRFDRVIMTGMGSSHYATIPLELFLCRRGLPVWRIQTSRLLEAPEMVTAGTLLWVTSQSGRSGEVIALLERLHRNRKPTIVATTNDPESPLARGADHVIDLRCGPEATVSCKSFLNTLAALYRVMAHVDGLPDEMAVSEIQQVGESLRAALAAPSPSVGALAERILKRNDRRLALVGAGADTTTALTGALILKEASKVPAEGYVGGAFRHGPMELAGPGLTVLLFGSGSPASNASLEHLSRDLCETGSIVVSISPDGFHGSEHIPVPASPPLGRLAHAMVAVQHLSVGLARGAGIVPGAFRFGQKVTAQL